MPAVEIQDAMERLAELVDLVVRDQCEVVLARDGKPVAKVTPYDDKPDVSKRIGGGRAILGASIDDMSVEEFNTSDAEIARLFYGGGEEGSGP